MGATTSSATEPGIDLEARVQYFFVSALRLTPEELDRKLVLDAGCGNGSQSVAYTMLGLEVVAVDLSAGVELGQAFRTGTPMAIPIRCTSFKPTSSRHLRDGTFDIVHSAGVLHHTPDTKRTFRRLASTLGLEGRFYVWLYKHEAGVTPLVNRIRAVTTRMTPSRFQGRRCHGACVYRLLRRP